MYGEKGYAIATGDNGLRVRLAGANAEETRTPAELKPEERDSILLLVWLAASSKRTGLNSLENNVVVVEILDAARGIDPHGPHGDAEQMTESLRRGVLLWIERTSRTATISTLWPATLLASQSVSSQEFAYGHVDIGPLLAA